MVTRRTSLLAGLLVAVLAVAACSGSSGGTIPDITGTWTGSGGSGGYVSHPGDTVRVTAANAPLHLVPDSAA